MHQPRQRSGAALLTLGALIAIQGIGCDSKTPTNTPTPTLSVSLAPLNFSGEVGRPVTAQTFDVQSAGSGALAWTTSTSASWLTVTPSQGSAAVGQSTRVTVAVNTAGLTADTHTATITVSAAGASNSPLSIAATLVLLPDTGARPTIGLASTSVPMGATAGGSDPNPVSLTVTNTGTGTLNDLALDAVTYDSGASGWLTASLNRAGAPATLSLSGSVGALSTGTYTAMVPITSTKASNSPQNVTVTFTVSDASTEIQLLPGTINFTAEQGASNPAPQTVQVTNPQGNTVDQLSVGTITYGAGASGWLTADLASTTTDTQLALGATTGALAVGSYTAMVPVQSTVASNSPQNVTVTFNVTAPPGPSVRLGPSVLNVTVDPGGTDTRAVLVTNGGGGDLGTLSLNPPSYGSDPGGWLTTSLDSSTAPAMMTLVFSHVPALAGGTYTANFSVDATGGTNALMQVSITMTGTPPIPPQVTTTNFNGSGLIRINPGLDFWLDFDLNLDPATVTTSNMRFERFDIVASAWVAVPFTINYNGALNRIEMFNSNTLVEFRNDYRIVVTPGITSAVGDPVASDIMLTFQTVAVSQDYFYTVQSLGQGQSLRINTTTNSCELGAAQNWFFRLNPGGTYQIRHQSFADSWNLRPGVPPSTCFLFNGPGGVPPADELWTFEGEASYQSGNFGLNATSDSGRRLDASPAAGPSHEVKVVGNNDQVWLLVRGAAKP